MPALTRVPCFSEDRGNHFHVLYSGDATTLLLMSEVTNGPVLHSIAQDWSVSPDEVGIDRFMDAMLVGIG